ncbi:hypothetical protein [Paenibacillus luteus]|uniref:hypothetical protein n=1 Tax=Paenibacillus luteus TaxID=2545753 RepID=UPI0019D55AD0|nr:hypothetical protein [Paenibacillus luteus]
MIGTTLPEESSPAQLVSTPPTDEQILQLINDTSPSLNPEIIYKEQLDDHQMLIFTSIVQSEESVMTWEAGLLDWTEDSMS